MSKRRSAPGPAEAGGGDDRGLRDRWRPRAAGGLRSQHRGRQRALRADRPAGGQLRRRLRRLHARQRGRVEEGEGDLVPLPPVRRAAGAADGPGQHRGAAGEARGGDGEVVRRDAAAQPAGTAHAEAELQRRPRRTGRHPGAGGRRGAALLHDPGGPGRARRLQGETEARLQEVPEAPVSELAVPRPGFGVWLMAARPRTLSAAVSPVLVGTAIAHRAGALRPPPALLALLASLFIQIGTNFANDYSDFKRGADANRLGPARVTQSGLVAPGTVKLAAWIAFGISGVLGIGLAALSGWPVIAIGVASVAAGGVHTAGRRAPGPP